MYDSEQVRAVEFYSGIGLLRSRIFAASLRTFFFAGGLHLALRSSGVPGAHVVAAYDWDQTACQVYAANFGIGNVHKVFRADVGARLA